MRAVVEELCFNNRLSIDDKNYFDLSKEVKEEVINRILDKIKKKLLIDLNKDYVVDLLEFLEVSEYESDLEPCEACGHYYESTTYEI